MKKSQSVMESTLAYIVIMAILSAATAVFGWGVVHMPVRQITYEATRVLAGTPRGRQVDESGAKQAFTVALWPTYCAGGGSCGYAP